MAKTNELKLNNFIDMEDISFSLTDIRSAIPKVNFRKIKLSRTNDINNSLKTKNITRIYLDDSLLKLDLPIKRVTEQESYDDHGREIKNPLRKKIELEETVPQITNEFLEQEEGIVEKIDKKEENIDVKEDITFNMEAQVAHEEENIILSPSVVSLPPFKKDVLSASGEQGNLVWPPKKQKEKKKFSKKRYKQKPYYLQEEKKPEEKKVEAKPTVFPWASANQEYEFLENIVQGGLESELLDLSYEKPSYEPKKINAEKITNLNQLVLKALVPEVQGDLYVGKFIFNKDSKENKVDVPLFKNVRIDYGIKLLGKGVKMFDKFSNLGGKVSPVRVVILSSLTITLGYLVWSYYFPNLQFIPQFEKKKEKVIVRDLFKEEHSYKKSLNVPKEKPPAQTKIEKGVQQEEFFKPISEQERISLIQKARESVESRLDPFGQEGVLPRSVIEQKIKEKEEE